LTEHRTRRFNRRVPFDQQEAVEALVEVLGELGLRIVHLPVPDAPHLELDLAGRHVRFMVMGASTVSLGPARDLSGRVWLDTVPVVVADRITEAARNELRDAGWGWLDLRGHLRLVGEGVFIDTDVAPLRYRPQRRDALSGAAGLEVACSLLLDPDKRYGVREFARLLGRAPSTMSEVLGALRTQGLITDDDRPVLPDLFWEVVDAWRPREVGLARLPRPGEGAINEVLQLGLDDVEGTLGWALTDTLAATAYGAPIAARSDYPPDFYVPTEAVSRRARSLLGVAASHEHRRATIRVAPVPMVCRDRVDPTEQSTDPKGWGATSEFWPLALPLFVALDLAKDPGRGREVLEGWTPPQPWRRVW
jgi:hypothetical protein